MYKEAELLAIGQNDVVKYLIKRMNCKEYRGKHYLQHSRTSPSHMREMLRIVLKHSDENGWLRIPRGDEFHPSKKPNGYKLGEYPEYEKVVNEVASLSGYKSSSSSQALKKINFVDFERFGFMLRKNVDSKGNVTLIEPASSKRISADYVKVTNDGQDLIKEENSIIQKRLVAESFKRTWSKEADILIKLLSDPEISILTVDEMVLFVSWINYSNEFFVSLEEMANLIKVFKNMSRNQRESIVDFFERNSRPELSKGNPEFWDWHNWKNEAQTIITLLSNSLLFKGTEKTISWFDKTSQSFKRQKAVIDDYIKANMIESHQLPKVSGFQFHHIVPFSWARNMEEFLKIDNVDNIVLISGTKHNQIHHGYGRTLVNLKYTDGVFALTSGSNDESKRIELVIGKDIFVSSKKIDDILKYNKNLIETL